MIHNFSGSKPHHPDLLESKACQINTVDIQEEVVRIDDDLKDSEGELYEDADCITALIMSVGHHMNF